MKICSLEAELFHLDERTEVKKLTVAFCNFANACKKYSCCKSRVLDKYSYFAVAFETQLTERSQRFIITR